MTNSLDVEDTTAMKKPLDDNSKKIEYKTLIKEKVLKPSKEPRYKDVRAHHQHLVIRDSHYLHRMPSSFITCSSCHRGRVLKIASIQESSTEEILEEIYSNILKNPCSKRKATTKESQEAFAKTYSATNKKPRYSSSSSGTSIQSSADSTGTTIATSTHDQNYSPLQPNSYFQQMPGLVHPQLSNDLSSGTATPHNAQLTLAQGGPVNVDTNRGGMNQVQQMQRLQQVHQSYPYATGLQGKSVGQQTQSPPHHNQGLVSKSTSRIPIIDDFLNDFEEIQEIADLNAKITINSIGSTTKVASYTLSTLFNGMSSFPTSLDLFLSLGIEAGITENFFTDDTLIIPLPAYSASMFMKDLNKNHFLTDESLTQIITKRIQGFISQQSINFQMLKIAIVFNYFQEGVPERPHENQSHKYVGNIYVITKFNVLQDLSLTFTTSRYTFNHSYSWVDPKEEWVKVETFNELIIKPLQSEIFMKYHQDLLGNHLHSSVLDRGSTMNLIPYTVDESFLVTSASSLYVVNFISLKILRVLCGVEGMQMLSYLLSVKVNTRHNLHLLKLLLDRLKITADMDPVDG